MKLGLLPEPFDFKKCPDVPTAKAAIALVPFPTRSPLAVSEVAPVPPFPIASVPVT